MFVKKSAFLFSFLFTCAVAAPALGAYPSDISPAEKAKALQRQLHLSNEQAAKVTTIYQESSQKLDGIKASESGNAAREKKSINALRASTLQTIRSVLTADQAVKYDVLVKKGKVGGVN
jgi:hypothetical protein